MSTGGELHELAGLRVTVDRVVYAPGMEAPPDRPHSFVYFITIHNDSTVAVTIKGRKWVVRESDGETIAVEGDGVVGQFPTILPAASFSYQSRHLLAGGAAVAEGSYLGVDANGRRVVVRIPAFGMQVPPGSAGRRAGLDD